MSRDFNKFWTADTITQYTGQVTTLAVPTIAAVTLEVTALQLALLNALAIIAFPLLGLFAGVIVDRIRRRPVMIISNLVRLAALASIPVTYYAGELSIVQLYFVAVVMGTCTLFFDVAYHAYLPFLIERKNLIKGNQRLQISSSSSMVIGPSLASALMRLIGAEIAVLADSAGFLASALFLRSIGKDEKEPALPAKREERNFINEMKEGARVIFKNRLLWTQAGCTAMGNLGSSMFYVALILYAYRVLLLTPSNIGIPLSIGAVGFVAGALLNSRLTKALGFGRSIALGAAMSFFLLVSVFATGGYKVEILGISLFLAYLGIPIYNINQVSLRQALTANNMQGRVNATMRTIIWGTQPIGSLIGGWYITVSGIVPDMILAGIIQGSSFLWIVFGPIFKLRDMPTMPA